MRCAFIEIFFSAFEAEFILELTLWYTFTLFCRRDDVIATVEFAIADLLDDGINGEFEMSDADGNVVGTVCVNINFEAGDGKSINSRNPFLDVRRFLYLMNRFFSLKARFEKLNKRLTCLFVIVGRFGFIQSGSLTCLDRCCTSQMIKYFARVSCPCVQNWTACTSLTTS